MHYSRTCRCLLGVLLAAVLFLAAPAAYASESTRTVPVSSQHTEVLQEMSVEEAGNTQTQLMNGTLLTENASGGAGTSESVDADGTSAADGSTSAEGNDASGGTITTDGTAASDGTTSTDGTAASDGTTTTDGTAASDGTATTDGTAASDGTTTDGTAASDGSTTTDGTAIPDGSTTTDGTAISDGSTTTDGIATSDGTTSTDGATTSDGTATAAGDLAADGALLPDGTAAGTEEAILGEGLLEEMIVRNDAKLENGIYTIYSALPGSKVLDIPGASQSNSVQAQIYSFNDSQAQQFYVRSLGNGLYSIENCSSGLVLDARKGGKTNGTAVQQYRSNNGKHQKWYILTTGTKGTYSIASALDKKMVLDVTGGKTANQTKVQLYQYNDSAKQRWTFKLRNPEVTFADGAYEIRSAKSSSKVLDVKGASKANSANVQLYASNGTAAQKFWLEADSNGFYEIRNLNSGRALDVKSGSRAEGTNVQQYAPNKTAAQKWRIFEAAGDTYIFYSGLGGRVLTVNNSTANGTNVQIGLYKRSDYQRFTLKRVSGSKPAVPGNTTAAPTPTPTAVKPAGKTVEEAEGLYTIHSLVGGLTMVEVEDGSFENSANVQIYQDNGKNWQKWYLVKKGEWYQIRSAQSGKGLDVKGGKNADGTNVQQYSKNSTDAQLWKFVSTGDKDGSVYIVSKLGKYLDVKAGNPSNNTNVRIFTGNKSKAQKFILAKTTLADGWTTDVNGKEYYYINGRKATGWHKIGSYMFYFGSDGVMAKNTTIDGFMLDSEGRRIGARISTRPKTLTHKKTILSLLKNAIVPCGRVLYIWAGGHEEPVASGLASYPDFWDDFYVAHASTTYNRHDYEWEKKAGLDCSGYVGWVVYNTLHSKSGEEWLAYSTAEMKNYYLNKGYANPDYINFKAATSTTLPGKVYPGDLCIMAGHVMICLGTCSDGSVVFIHSSPSDGDGGGVQISGTKRPVKVTKDGKTTIEWKSDSQAAALAQKYMSKYFPEWPFGTRSALPSEYMRFAYGRIHWKTDVLSDPDGVIKMSADQVLKLLLGPV